MTQIPAAPAATAPEGDVSPFALDVYFASGKTGDPALRDHVEGCARCQAYLASLDALATPPVPRVDRAALRADASSERPARKLAGKRAWHLPLAGIAALAAGAALMLRAARDQPHSPDRYVGIKGTPAVQVLVHRGTDTHVWDGRAKVRPGDALALRVACEGLGRVAVAAPGADGWSRLTAAECTEQTEQGEALPFTLRVDDAPGDERLAVVMSQAPLDDAALKRAIEEGRRGADVWVVSFVMPKELEGDR
jgi:hypothetical protein